MNQQLRTLSPGELKALYPHQFDGPGVEWMSFFRGWMPVVVDMCHEVDALMHGRLDRYSFHWVQIKEKLGAGRFSYHLDVPAADVEPDFDPDNEDAETHQPSQETIDLRKALLEIKLRAQRCTASLCIACGKPSELVSDTAWWLTLCPEHAAMHRRGEEFGCALADDGSELRLP